MDATWFSKNLGDGLTAAEPLAEIESRFGAMPAPAAGGHDAAVFMRYESEGRLHCEVKAYFSPACAALAGEFGATPCARPAPASLTLLAGDAAAWAALFPEQSA